MIKTLDIQNFKSIKHLRLDTRRINAFIGEPNTGKSNILEALGFYCYALYPQNPLRRFVRFERTTNLFYDELLENPIQIALDKVTLNVAFQDGGFRGTITGESGAEPLASITGNHTNLEIAGSQRQDKWPPARLYRFEVLEKFEPYSPGYLLPPDGKNLLSLLLGQKELREMAAQVFSRFGLRIVLKPQEQKIEVQKQLEDVAVAYPYSLTSDTIQRVIFYLAAVLSNRNAVLVLEEPESHAFPYYTRYLAETIALDSRQNQYFVSTHNPYFLMPLVEKTPKDDLAVFLTYFKDYQTRIRPLTAEDIEEIMQIDVFSNLDRYLERE